MHTSSSFKFAAYEYLHDKLRFYMKFYILIGILLIYFPVLYYFKNRIIRETTDVDTPEHLRWYEGASYVISHTADAGKRNKLVKLREQIRMAGITGIIIFWLIVLFFPA